MSNGNITYTIDRPDLAGFFFFGFGLTIFSIIAIACLISDYRKRKASK